jgi:hypothetical protein
MLVDMYTVTIRKEWISGVATQGYYTYGPMTEKSKDRFLLTCDSKGYDVTNVCYLNSVSTFDTGDDLSS